MIGEPGGTGHHHRVAAADDDPGYRIAASGAAGQKDRVGAEAERDDRLGPVALVLVAMQAQPTARRAIAVDEEALRPVARRRRRTERLLEGEADPSPQGGRRRGPGASGQGMAARIAIALSIREPAPFPGIGHLDPEGPTVRHGGGDKRRLRRNRLAGGDQLCLGSAVEQVAENDKVVDDLLLALRRLSNQGGQTTVSTRCVSGGRASPLATPTMAGRSRRSCMT